MFNNLVIGFTVRFVMVFFLFVVHLRRATAMPADAPILVKNTPRRLACMLTLDVLTVLVARFSLALPVQ